MKMGFYKVFTNLGQRIEGRVGGWEAGAGGWGGRWQQLFKKLSREAPQ